MCEYLAPLLVPRPIPVTVQPETGKVTMRVFRVSESLGRIRRYYLILCKVLTTDSLNLTPKTKEFNWPQKVSCTKKQFQFGAILGIIKIIFFYGFSFDLVT